MKKFFQKQAADWRFRKAGAGHRLDEEKPKIQPKKSQPGRFLEISTNLIMFTPLPYVLTDDGHYRPCTVPHNTSLLCHVLFLRRERLTVINVPGE